MTKLFYLFSERGITDRYYCGNIYEQLPTDEIRVDGERISFEFAETIGRCKSFETRKEANDFSRSEMSSMEDENQYAQRAMDDEERYGN